eukprot:c12414_g2_i1.p1 GENE.c12414_g2_i1~~c12414_g2_i1.p1  ORF type:complete len:246 (+),score=10.93 c12414_g2_i1:70-807(+)
MAEDAAGGPRGRTVSFELPDRDDEVERRFQVEPRRGCLRAADFTLFDVDTACGPASAEYLRTDRNARRLRRRSRQLRKAIDEAEPLPEPSPEPRNARDDIGRTLLQSMGLTLGSRPSVSLLDFSPPPQRCIQAPFVTLTSSFLAAPERQVSAVRGISSPRTFNIEATHRRHTRELERGDAPSTLSTLQRRLRPPKETMLSRTLAAMHSPRPLLLPDRPRSQSSSPARSPSRSPSSPRPRPRQLPS